METQGEQELTQCDSTQHKEQFNIHPNWFNTIDPSIGLDLGGEVDFPNDRCQTPYHIITLSGLNFKNFHSFQSPFKAIITRMFIPFQYSKLSQQQQGMG